MTTSPSVFERIVLDELNDSPQQKCRDDQQVFQQFGATGANHRLNEQKRQAYGQQGQG